MHSILMFVTLLLAPRTVAQAQQTLTTRDIVELSKAGLAEEVLIALIDVHRPVFPVDTVTLKGLKDAGVAPNVIVAMIKSGREFRSPPVVVETGTSATAASALVRMSRSNTSNRASGMKSASREVAVPVYVTMPVRLRWRTVSRRSLAADRATGRQAGGTGLLGFRRKAASRLRGMTAPACRRTPRFRRRASEEVEERVNFQLPTTNYQLSHALRLEVGSWTLEVVVPRPPVVSSRLGRP